MIPCYSLSKNFPFILFSLLQPIDPAHGKKLELVTHSQDNFRDERVVWEVSFWCGGEAGRKWRASWSFELRFGGCRGLSPGRFQPVKYTPGQKRVHASSPDGDYTETVQGLTSMPHRIAVEQHGRVGSSCVCMCVFVIFYRLGIQQVIVPHHCLPLSLNKERGDLV